MRTAIPAPRQLAYQDWEFGLFLHFGICRFPLVTARGVQFRAIEAHGPARMRSLCAYNTEGSCST